MMAAINKPQDWYVFWKIGDDALGSERAIDEEQAQAIAAWRERTSNDQVLVMNESELRGILFPSE